MWLLGCFMFYKQTTSKLQLCALRRSIATHIFSKSAPKLSGVNLAIASQVDMVAMLLLLLMAGS
jgi:hypothetical protein